MIKRVLDVALLSVVVIVAALAPAVCSVPTTISYQGKLTQPSGEPFSDGAYSITFSIYTVPNGGTAVWTETNGSVQLKGGLFSVLLGGVTPIQPPVFSEPDRWFGIKVGDATEMVPRQKIASVAYAQTAADANPPGTVVMYGGVAAPQGWLLCQGQGVSRTTYAALFAALGTRYGVGDGSTTFNLPNLQSRFPIGASGTYALGAIGGSSTKNLQHYHSTASHALTTAEMPSHNHNFIPNGADIALLGADSGEMADSGDPGGFAHVDPLVIVTATQNAGSGAAHSHGNTGNGLSTTQDVMNPYLAINYIIKL